VPNNKPTSRRKDDNHDEVIEEEIAFADSDSDLGSLTGDEGGLNNRDEEDFDSGVEYEDEEDEDEGALRWKSNLHERAKKLHSKQTPQSTAQFARLMYNLELSPLEVLKKWKGEEEEELEDEEDAEEDDFFNKSKETDPTDTDDRLQSTTYDLEALEAKWESPENIELLMSRFAIGHASGKNADADEDDSFEGFDEDDEGDGEFEDLETGESFSGKEAGSTADGQNESLEDERARNARRKEELKLRFEEEDKEGFMNDRTDSKKEGGAEEEVHGEDDWYDAQRYGFSPIYVLTLPWCILLTVN